MKPKSQRINKNTTLAKILEKTGAKEILAKNGVPCISCPMAKFEIENLKIGQACKIYGIDLDNLLEDINN